MKEWRREGGTRGLFTVCTIRAGEEISTLRSCHPFPLHVFGIFHSTCLEFASAVDDKNPLSLLHAGVLRDELEDVFLTRFLLFPGDEKLVEDIICLLPPCSVAFTNYFEGKLP